RSIGVCSVSTKTKSIAACLTIAGHSGDVEIIADENTGRPSCRAAAISRPFIRESPADEMGACGYGLNDLAAARIPCDRIHSSQRVGHWLTGFLLCRMPKPWPPVA